MKSLINRLASFFSALFASGASLSMFALFGLILFNSIRRYTIGKSYTWGEELPVFIAIYGVVFGAAWAYMQDRHIRFTMMLTFLNKKQRRWLMMLVDLIMAVTCVVLTYSGWLFVVKRGGVEASGLIGLAKSLSETTSLDWVIWLGHLYPWQAAIMIGGAMLSTAAVLKFFQRLLGCNGRPHRKEGK